MKVKFINELKDDVVSQKFLSIPQEKYVEFFNEIVPLLNLPREVKRLEIELAWAFSRVTSDPKEVSVRFYYYYGKGWYGSIRLNIEGLTFDTVLRDEDELNARWAEFLKDNLGIDVYKKLLAAKTKAKLQDTEWIIESLERRVEGLEKDLQKANADLEEWKQTQQANKERFKAEYGDLLDNGEIIGL